MKMKISFPFVLIILAVALAGSSIGAKAPDCAVVLIFPGGIYGEVEISVDNVGQLISPIEDEVLTRVNNSTQN
jgi:hypothetical protein